MEDGSCPVCYLYNRLYVTWECMHQVCKDCCGQLHKCPICRNEHRINTDLPAPKTDVEWDISLLMRHTSVSHAEALEAYVTCNGDLVEAVILLNN